MAELADARECLTRTTALARGMESPLICLRMSVASGFAKTLIALQPKITAVSPAGESARRCQARCHPFELHQLFLIAFTAKPCKPVVER